MRTDVPVRLAVAALAGAFALAGCGGRHAARGLVLRVDDRAATVEGKDFSARQLADLIEAVTAEVR